MKIDGITLTSGATITNFKYASGTSFPANPQIGQPFVLTADYSTYEAGNYVYKATGWVEEGDITGVTSTSGTSSVSLINSGGSTGVVQLSALIPGTNVTLTKDGSGNIVVDASGSSGITKAQADTYYPAIADYNSFVSAVPTTYATQSSLSSYLTTSAASSTYLTQSSASSTYATQSSLSSYLTTSSASSTYQPIMSVTGSMIGLSTNQLSLSTEATSYDFGSSIIGQPGAGAIVSIFTFVRAFNLPVNFSGSVATSTVPAGASAVFVVNKDGSQIGSFTFASGQTTATFSSTFSSPLAVTAASVITIVAPATKDTALAYIGFAFKGNIQ
jgi:hypothetical protein